MESISTTIQRRIRHAPVLVQQEAHGLLQELRLFARRPREHCVFRQSRIDGLRALVRADDEVGRCMYFYQEFEVDDSAFVFNCIRDTDVCIDIGANVGFYSLGFSKRATQGAVHSFEPVPLNYHLLALNVIDNGLSNVVVNNCAVGDINGESDLCIARDGAYSSFVDTGRKPIQEKLRTKVVTLDSYCVSANCTRVDILKVDVEGAEPMVLRGCSGLLADTRRRPRLIMLELLDCMLRLFHSTIMDVNTVMGGYGYDPFVVLDKKLVPFVGQHHNRVQNVMFLDRSKFTAQL
jgi:FkbM family methyltransferase